MRDNPLQHGSEKTAWLEPYLSDDERESILGDLEEVCRRLFPDGGLRATLWQRRQIAWLGVRFLWVSADSGAPEIGLAHPAGT